MKIFQNLRLSDRLRHSVNFQSRMTIRDRVKNFINRAHAAMTNFSNYPVRSDLLRNFGEFRSHRQGFCQFLSLNVFQHKSNRKNLFEFRFVLRPASGKRTD